MIVASVVQFNGFYHWAKRRHFTVPFFCMSLFTLLFHYGKARMRMSRRLIKRSDYTNTINSAVSLKSPVKNFTLTKISEEQTWPYPKYKYMYNGTPSFIMHFKRKNLNNSGLAAEIFVALCAELQTLHRQNALVAVATLFHGKSISTYKMGKCRQ